MEGKGQQRIRVSRSYKGRVNQPNSGCYVMIWCWGICRGGGNQPPRNTRTPRNPRNPNNPNPNTTPNEQPNDNPETPSENNQQQLLIFAGIGLMIIFYLYSQKEETSEYDY